MLVGSLGAPSWSYAGDDSAEMKARTHYAAGEYKEALEIYQADDTPMSFTAAVRHRKALKLLGLWRSVT